MKITRIAPSPTELIHLGNIRTAYHNYLAAKSTDGKFILRIDNTDRTRNKQEYLDKIFEAFEWLGLKPDSIEYQSENLERYNRLANFLVKKGYAINENGAIVLNASQFIPNYWSDEICGRVTVSNREKEISSRIVLIKSDGTPAYNFCSIIDDMEMGVTDIIRGNDHISNTSKQFAVAKALEFDCAVNLRFFHEGLIFKDGKKLSKREKTGDLDYYRNTGYLPESILNWVLKLGWSHPNPEFDREYPILRKEQAVKVFAEGRLKGASSSLDLNKLDWYDKQYKKFK